MTATAGWEGAAQPSLAEASRRIREALQDGSAKCERGYFIQQGDDGPVKIGVANDTRTRIGRLQTGSPVPLRILAVWQEFRGFERELHDRFAEHRLHGEWFAPAPEILAEAAFWAEVMCFELRDAHGENDDIPAGEW